MNYYDYTIKLIHRNLKQENIIIESINPEKYFYNLQYHNNWFCYWKKFDDFNENKVLGRCFYIASEVLNKKI